MGGRDSVKLSDKATVIHRDGADTVSIRYYNSDVVKYHRDGTCEVSTDGLRMKTLKSRINKYLPDGYKLYQKKFKWMLKSPEGEKEFSDYTRFDITKREDEIGKELDKKVYAEGKQDNTTMEKVMPKKTYTLEEVTIAHAQAGYMRFFPELLEQGGGMGGASAPQDDPAAAATGTFPAPGATPDPSNQMQGPKTASTKQPGGLGGRSQEIADEIFDLMKEEGDTSEGFLTKYFEAKGYKSEDVKGALKQLEDEGKLHSRTTYMVTVEEEPGDQEKDASGVTPDSTEPDMTAPGEGAGAGGPPGAGAEGSAGIGNAMHNYMDDDDAGFDGEQEDIDDEDVDDDELEGNEDHLPDMHGDEGDEMDGGDEVEEIRDDIRDAQSLLKSIMSRLDQLKSGGAGGGDEEMDMGGEEEMPAAAMKNYSHNRPPMRGTPAKNPMRRNPMMDDSDFGNYPAWGEKRRGR